MILLIKLAHMHNASTAQVLIGEGCAVPYGDNARERQCWPQAQYQLVSAVYSIECLYRDAWEMVGSGLVEDTMTRGSRP